MNRTLFIVALLAFLAVPATAEAGVRLSFDAGTSSDELTGVGRFDDGGVVGDSVNLENDLGLESESSIRFGVNLDWGRLHLGFAYANVEFEAASTLTRTITFQGVTFAANAATETKAELPLMQGEFSIDIFSPEAGGATAWDWFGLSLGLSVNYYDFKIDITGEEDLTANAIEESYDTPVPAPAVLVGLKLHPMRDLLFDAELAYLKVKVGDSEATVMDLNLTATYFVTDMIGINARVGTYSLEATIEEDDVDADLELSHFQIGGGVSIRF